jgi:hypothetical protein
VPKLYKMSNWIARNVERMAPGTVRAR